MELALEEGVVDANLAREHGVTLLMQATKHGSRSICKFLVKFGSDRTLRNGQGYMACDYIDDDDEMAALLCL